LLPETAESYFNHKHAKHSGMSFSMTNQSRPNYVYLEYSYQLRSTNHCTPFTQDWIVIYRHYWWPSQGATIKSTIDLSVLPPLGEILTEK